MASVYKRGKDKKVKGASWYFQYKDENGVYLTRKGFTDKGTTTQLANKLEREAKLRAMGLIDPELERQAVNRKSTIDKQLERYRTHLVRKFTAGHARTVSNRIQRVFGGCEFSTLGEIQDDVVEGCLVNLKIENNFSNSTYNHYIDGLNSFCNWLVKGKRLTHNPLRHLERLSNETDIRHRRRALTPNEFADLIESARSSMKAIQTYTGVERARIYITAYYTGLRRRELGNIRKSNFRLEASPPTVTVEASIAKNRKKDVLPLNEDLVDMLKKWMHGFEDDQLLFPGLDKRKTWLMVKKTLKLLESHIRTVTELQIFMQRGGTPTSLSYFAMA